VNNASAANAKQRVRKEFVPEDGIENAITITRFPILSEDNAESKGRFPNHALRLSSRSRLDAPQG
jgi:hypothetical protein